MNFGTNLRNLRIQRHLSQQKLADELEVSQSSIAAYETGEREPSFAVIEKIAAYFGVPASTLTPFSTATNDYVQNVADSLHSNPKLQLLFDRSKYLSESDLDTVLAVVSAISRERGE